MTISLKSQREIDLMRQAGAIVAEVLDLLRRGAVPGVTTEHLDQIAYAFILERGGYPSFLDYEGFPASICTSVNDQIIHGIPSRTRLADGDILSVDVGVAVHGYHADAAATFGIGEISEEATRLIETAESAFRAGLAQARAGNRMGDIGAAIEAETKRNGFSVVEMYAGHGVGQELHEEPDVPNEGRAGSGLRLRSGMTLAIEPMVAAGSGETTLQTDGWTVVTRDGALAAHYEHTVLITAEEPVLLSGGGSDVVS